MGRREIASLIINTASSSEVAICHDGKVEKLSSDTSSAESLTDLLQNLSFDYRKVDNIYFVSGPGSYTGLRVGLAYATGIALSLDKPLILVSSMLALCLSVDFEAMADKTMPSVSLALRASKKDYYSSSFIVERTKAGRVLCLPKSEVDILDSVDADGLDVDFSSIDFTFEKVELDYEKLFDLLHLYKDLKEVSFYNHYGSDEILYVKPVPAKSLKERNIVISD